MERAKDVWKRRLRGESVVPSTIGEEMETNPFMRTTSTELIANVAMHLPQADLGNDAKVFESTRKLKDLKHYKGLEVPSLWTEKASS